jgi:hypothetical protein
MAAMAHKSLYRIFGSSPRGSIRAIFKISVRRAFAKKHL